MAEKLLIPFSQTTKTPLPLLSSLLAQAEWAEGFEKMKNRNNGRDHVHFLDGQSSDLIHFIQNKIALKYRYMKNGMKYAHEDQFD